jgi:nucleoside-diphosphate-sugar epimerase
MILVTGATGYTGGFLARSLLAVVEEEVRFFVRPSSDRSRLPPGPSEVFAGDLARPKEVAAACRGVSRIVHLAHIRYARTLVECLASSVDHVVMISSLRRFSQVESVSVEEVIRGEECALNSGIPCTILRPSMIFGPGDDRNISRMAAHLRRIRCIPVFGSGRHLQQPVFVDDVVGAILASLARGPGGEYALAGPRALSYNEVIDLVGNAIGVRPLKLHIPVHLALAVCHLARILPIELALDGEQVRRLQEDKCYAIDAAAEDLDFAPLGFEAALTRIYRSGPEATPGHRDQVAETG